MKIEDLFQDKEIAYLDTIHRWGQNKTLVVENVSQHSFWVGLFSTCLAEEIFPDENCTFSAKIKLRITRLALFHDLDEFITGDINHTVKNNVYNGSDIKENLDLLIEKTVLDKFDTNAPFSRMMLNYLVYDHKLDLEKHIVKICDWLSFLKYLQNEIDLGNKTVEGIKEYCVAGVQKQILKTKNILRESLPDAISVNLEVLENLI